MKRFNRHALYYRLMDVAFACQMWLVFAWIYKHSTGEGIAQGIFAYPHHLVIQIALLLPPLLVFQRWMRDDFSEMLWQRTAGTVLKAVVVLPIPLMFIVVVSIGARVSVGLDQASEYLPKSGRTMGLPPALESQFIGYVWSMVLLWVVASLLFTVAFQWHRWRASR